MSTNLTWKNIATVAAQKGYDKNLGTAGLVKGVLGNYLVFGGGANFKDGVLPVDGGIKINHKDLYLYRENTDGSLYLVDQIQFNYPLAYGPSAVSDDKLYYIATKDETSAEILELTVVDEKLKIQVIDTLPFSVENIIAEVYDNTLYFGIGAISGKTTTELYSYHLDTKTFEVASEFPGTPRTQALSYIYKDELYIYGGGADVTFSDGYKFNFATKTWTKLADVIVENEEISLLGADWAPLSDDELLVIGGFDKEVWRDAVFNLTTLVGDERAKFRDAYFRRAPRDFNWNTLELVYNLSTNSWHVLDEIPFDAPCGHALLATKDYIYSIMGEIKPAERLPYIHQTKK